MSEGASEESVGVVYDDVTKSHTYADADALRGDVDLQRNGFWGRKAPASGLISLRFYFHDLKGNIDLGWRSSEGRARVARVLANETLIRYCQRFDVPMMGVVPSFSSFIPRVSDDVVADVERLQTLIDNAYNGIEETP